VASHTAVSVCPRLGDDGGWVYSITFDEALEALHRFTVPIRERHVVPGHVEVVLDTLALLRALPKVRGMNDIYEPAFTQNLNRAYAGEITATEAARLIDEKATPLIKKG